MKKYSLIIPLLLFTLLSCTKDNGTATIITYQLEGLTDLTLNFHKPESFLITFNQKGTISEKISLYFSGLPPGVSIDSNYVKSGTPDFSSFISFFADSSQVSPGTYTISLHCIGSVSGERIFNFKIILNKKTGCNQPILGFYGNCNYNVSGKLVKYVDIVAQDSTGNGDIIVFQNLGNLGGPVYGYLYCDQDSIDIPVQYTTSWEIYGGGKFSYHSINLNLLVSYNGIYFYNATVSM